MMNSFLLLLSLALLLAVSPLAAAQIHTYTRVSFNDCGGGEITYEANSTYEANLRRLAAVLPAAVSASGSTYAYRAVGFWPNRVSAYSLCRRRDGDISCAACVAGAFRKLETTCPYHRDAYVSYRNCSLQVSEVRLLDTENHGMARPKKGNYDVAYCTSVRRSLIYQLGWTF